VKCGEEIKQRENLITGFRFISVKPFHDTCFAKHNRRSLFGRYEAVNGPSYTFTAVVIGLIGIALFAFLLLGDNFSQAVTGRRQAPDVVIALFGIFLFVPLYVRYYSWTRFETHLPE